MRVNSVKYNGAVNHYYQWKEMMKYGRLFTRDTITVYNRIAINGRFDIFVRIISVILSSNRDDVG